MDVILFKRIDELTTRMIAYGNVSTYRRNTAWSLGFTKPDKPVRNAIIDGYRKPSDYACPRYETGKKVDFRAGQLRFHYTLSGQGFDKNKFEWTFRGGLTTYGSFATPTALNVNALRTKVLNNVRDEVFDAAMVLAELQSTVNTVSSNLDRIGRSLLIISKKKPRHFYYLLNGKTRDGRRPTQRFLKESSGVFLEWKYGITPSLMDLEGACAALDLNSGPGLFDNPPLLVARAHLQKITHGFIRGSILEASGDSAKVNIPVTHTRELKARCDYRISGDGLRGLNRFGLGVGSIATVLWDKKPFSFVLDMVVPIADILKAWSALQGTTIVGYSETDYENISVKRFTSGVVLRSVPCSYDVSPYESPSFSRRSYASPPMPMPYVKNPIKTGNISTVLALFTQLRKSA